MGITKQSKVEFAEQDWTDWKAGTEHRALALRLPQRDVDDIRFLLCELESRVGLRSSMGSQIERLAQRMGREDVVEEIRSGRLDNIVPARKTPATQADAVMQHLEETETPAESLARRSHEAMAHLPSHVKYDLPPEEPVTARVKRPRARYRRHARTPEYLCGARVAKGYRPETMLVKADGGGGNLRMVSDDEGGLVSALYASEEWACPKNRKDARRAAGTRAAFDRIQRAGDGDLVNALYAYYSGALPDAGHAPPHLRGDEENGGAGATATAWEFPSLGDLSPLATHIRSVVDHASALTRKFRAALADASWEPRGTFEAARCGDRRETETLRTAAHDLLDRRKGETLTAWDARTSPQKVECQQLLVLASNAYLAAKKATR